MGVFRTLCEREEKIRISLRDGCDEKCDDRERGAATTVAIQECCSYATEYNLSTASGGRYYNIVTLYSKERTSYADEYYYYYIHTSRYIIDVRRWIIRHVFRGFPRIRSFQQTAIMTEGNK